MSAALGFKAARDAAVKVVDADGDRRGAGLLLDVPGRGPLILTCHHVARPERGGVGVVTARGRRVAVTYQPELSRPACDTAVLVPDEPVTAPELPLLHVPDPDEFVGPLPVQAVSPGAESDTFSAQLGAANRVELAVDWPPDTYVLDAAFQLDRPANVRAGISGSPVSCEDGVVGLVHFARDASNQLAALAYVNPVTAWCDAVPELAGLVEPFVPSALRRTAAVLWAEALPRRETLKIPGFRPDVYLPRPEEAAARAALERNRQVLVVGRRNTGKSRLVCQILRDHPEAVVVIPQPGPPPQAVSDMSFFRSREVILVFENVHLGASLWRPLEWHQFFQPVAKSTALLLTSWNQEYFDRLKEAQRDALDLLEPPPPVFLGREEGEDLSAEEGWQLAQQIGMDRATFEALFDGTPGSLLAVEDAPPAPGPSALEEEPDARVVIRPPDAAGSEPRHNLPAFTSAYVPRPELEGRIARLLERARLVSLTGPAGAGKTRLAVELAGRLADRYPDGVWFADLTAARAEDQVVAVLTATIGAQHATIDSLAATEEALVEHLRARRGLLILNGPDQARDATARFVDRLMRRRGRVRLLVTVREPLGIGRAVELPPFDPAGAGRELFRARTSEGGGAALETAAPEHVDSLVDDLQGNAAALEVTAAHVRESGVEHVAGLAGGDDAGPADALERAVLRSLSDLSESESAVFARLGGLPDWFTLTAAREVAADDDVPEGAVQPAIQELVERALLLVDERDPTEQRYRFLPSIRDVAAGELARRGEADAVLRRHAAYYLEVAERASRRLDGRSSQRWLEALDRERLHLQAALRWSAQHDLATALRIAARVWIAFVYWSRFAEGRRWLDELIHAARPRALELDPPDARELVAVLDGAGYLAYHLADYTAVERYVAQAREARQVVLAAARRESRGDLDEAAARHRRSFALYARLGLQRGCAMAQCDLAYVLADHGDLEGAAELLEDSLATRRRIGDLQGEAQSLNGLGRLERERGRSRAALEHHQRALALFQQIGDTLRIAETFEALALVHLRSGSSRADRLLERAARVREAIGTPRPPALLADIEQARSAAPTAERRRGRHTGARARRGRAAAKTATTAARSGGGA